MNQQRSGERKGSRSLDPQYADYLALLAKNGRFGKSLAGAPPNRFSALYCAAQLRETAFNYI